MAWHIVPADMPGKPFAVIDGNGQVAGCHPSRFEAVRQMSALNVSESLDLGDTSVPEPRQKAEEAKPEPRHEPPPVSYSTSHTSAW